MFNTTPYKSFHFMSIDPGLHNIGVADFGVTVEPPEINTVRAFTLSSHRLVDTSGLDADDYIERIRVRYSMMRSLRGVLDELQPEFVVCESPFFDRRKPGSFAILTEVMVSILDTIIAWNPYVRFTVVEPQVVKKALGVAGQKGKDVVKDAVIATPDLASHLLHDIDDLDEHGIDALGVGYAYWRYKSGLFPISGAKS